MRLLAAIGVPILSFGLIFGAVTTVSAAFRTLDSTRFVFGERVWSPDGSQVVFGLGSRASALETSLYTLDVRDGNTRRLLDDVDTLRHPTWSPDGERIAMTVGDGATLAVYTFADATLRPLVDDPLHKLHPSWSPDGTRLAYITTNFTATHSLWVVDLDGNAAQLRDDLREPYDFPARWSPDGTRLAIPNTETTLVIDAETGATLHELPFWSKENVWAGEQLAVFLWRDAGGYTKGVYIYDTATDDLRALPTRGGDVIDLNWQGDDLLYMVYGGVGGFEGRRVFRRPLESADSTLLTSNGHEFNEMVRWSGEWVAYGGRHALYIMDSHSGETVLQYDPYRANEEETRLISLVSLVGGGLLVVPLLGRKYD